MRDIQADPFGRREQAPDPYPDPKHNPADFAKKFKDLGIDLSAREVIVVVEQQAAHSVGDPRKIGAIMGRWYIDKDSGDGDGKVVSLPENLPSDSGSESLPLPVAA